MAIKAVYGISEVVESTEMLDRRAMFAHGMPMVRSTSPDQISEACKQDAERHRASTGAIACPACGDRLRYRLRQDSIDSEGGIYVHCQRSGCIAVLG